MPAIKAISIDQLPPDAWRALVGSADGDGDPLALYRRVGVVHRCVKIRAKSVQSMPLALYRGKTDISELPDGLVELQRVRRLLYLAEASLCIYGRAHALKERGPLTGEPRLRWVASPGLAPKYDDRRGLVGFERRTGEAAARTLKPEEVWSVWLQDPANDVGADVSPVAVALRAGGVLEDLDTFLERFFEGGAIKATLLRVKTIANEGEKKKLEAWWKKTLRGVKNAFNAAAVSADVEPVVIGDSLTDTVNPELSEQKTMDVLTAMEVPASLVLANAANYATAERDALNFYTLCVIPEAEAIRDALNEQFFADRGLELVTLPERLEVFQAAELEKAAALNSLTGDVPTLTQSEARQRLNLAPLAADSEEARRLELSAMLSLAQQARDLGYPLEQVAALVGLPAPELPAPAPIIIEQTPPALEAPEPAQEPTPEAQRALDLDRWRRKALRRLERGQRPACEFASPWIDPDTAAEIAHALAHAGDLTAVKAAFKAREPGEGLTDQERALYEALGPLLARWGTRAVTALLSGESFDEAGFSAALRGLLLGELAGVAMAALGDLAEAIGPEFDEAILATEASRWARQYTFELVTGLTGRTRELIATATASYLETPGMTRAQVEALLSGAFGARRAEAIAVTEITRAASAATTVYQQQLAAAGLTFERVWRTVSESSVCPICEPLDGKGENEWAEQHPAGPPAHPKCRCATTLRRVTP
jgi:phage portal protein BeeE